VRPAAGEQPDTGPAAEQPAAAPAPEPALALVGAGQPRTERRTGEAVSLAA
jgi:hypothetical protein